MIRTGTIPRFALPYTAGDFLSAAGALLRSTIANPDPFTEVLGPGAKFWTASGRQALWLILKALRLPPGTGVAVPLFNDLSVAAAIVEAGYRPVYVDVDMTLTLDPASLEAAHGQFQAMVPIHLFGNVARIDRLVEVAGPIPFVEDTAHAPLSAIHGRAAGSLGAGCFYSFASTKYWPAGGGGLAVVNNAEIALRVAETAQSLKPKSRLSELRNLMLQGAKAATFRRPWYGLAGMGLRSWAETKSILEPELNPCAIQRHQAAVALRQAQQFRDRVAKQRANSLHLLALLRDTENVVLPEEWPGATYNYHIFSVLLAGRAERDAVARGMLRDGVDTSRIYFNIVEHARELGYQGGCPVSESVPHRLLTLPNYASLSRADIERVADVFLRALRRFRSGS
jgi:dTDP-4-amino-4,6-dideoxygalactose transaminase